MVGISFFPFVIMKFYQVTCIIYIAFRGLSTFHISHPRSIMIRVVGTYAVR